MDSGFVDVRSQYLEIANQIKETSLEVASGIHAALEGKDFLPIWVARWQPSTYGVGDIRQTGARALVLTKTNLPFNQPSLVLQIAHYDCIRACELMPNNCDVLKAARRARDLGLGPPIIEPVFATPDLSLVTTREEFKGAIEAAQIKWEESAFPFRPGFVVLGIPEAWLDTHFNVAAFLTDGSRRFEARFCKTGERPIKFDKIPEDAEWRLPNRLVRRLDQLYWSAHTVAREVQYAEGIAVRSAERRRLAEQFGITDQLQPQ